MVSPLDTTRLAAAFGPLLGAAAVLHTDGSDTLAAVTSHSGVEQPALDIGTEQQVAGSQCIQIINPHDSRLKN